MMVMMMMILLPSAFGAVTLPQLPFLSAVWLVPCSQHSSSLTLWPIYRPVGNETFTTFRSHALISASTENLRKNFRSVLDNFVWLTTWGGARCHLHRDHEQGGGPSKADKKKEPRGRTPKNSMAWGKSSKQRGKKAAAKKAGKPERSEKRGMLGKDKKVHGAEKDGDRNVNRPTPPVEGANSDTQGEAKNPSPEGRTVDVENFSLEHIRYENKSDIEHDAAERQTGASPAAVGTAQGLRTGEAAGVQASVTVAQKSTAASGQPQRVGDTRRLLLLPSLYLCLRVFISFVPSCISGPLLADLVAYPGLVVE